VAVRFVLNKPPWESFPAIKNVFSTFEMKFLLGYFIAPLDFSPRVIAIPRNPLKCGLGYSMNK